jgi:glucose/mannose-6-phosphate isomerase
MKYVLDKIDYNRVDPDGMFKSITSFPTSAKKAVKNTEETKCTVDGKKFTSMLVLGMGGSAIGGLLLRDWLLDTLEIPITVSRGYHIPAWVNKKTLVYAVSYSGNTEETLSQYYEAVNRGCTIICFCSGGSLAEKGMKNFQTIVKFPKGQQPRAAIPYQFYSLAGVTRKIGLIEDEKWTEIDESIKVIASHCAEMKTETPTVSNIGKQLALQVMDRIPFIYTPRLFESVGYRYNTQFNENSKSPASTNFYPEAFHNSIMAREGKQELLNRICVIIVQDPKGNERLNRKIQISKKLMNEKFGKVIQVETKGESNLARLMSALIQGDYLSAYLAILYNLDPSTTDSIRILKESMGD